LGDYRDTEYYADAAWLLEPGIADRIQTKADLKRAVNGEHGLLVTVATRSAALRKASEAIGKQLSILIARRFLPAVQFDKAIDELQAAWLEAMGLVMPYAPQDIQDQVGSLMKTLFDGIREDLAK
jgi:hypothetical protein